MLPSPAKLRSHNFAEPVNCRQHYENRKSPRGVPCVKPPSRIVIQQSSTEGAFTSLVLSLPLVKKIHELILTSRRIQLIADGFYSGYLTEHQSKYQMDSLFQGYDRLRDSVVSELEAAWVAAGFLPAHMPTYPPASEILDATTDRRDWYREKDPTEKNLKRSWVEEGEETEQTESKKMKLERQESTPPTPHWEKHPLTYDDFIRFRDYEIYNEWGKGEAKFQSPELSPKTMPPLHN